MKLIVILLMLSAPSMAQSIDPVMYGQRFCELRKMNVDAAPARKAAVDYSFDASRPASGRDADTSAAAKYVVDNNCHQ